MNKKLTFEVSFSYKYNIIQLMLHKPKGDFCL